MEERVKPSEGGCWLCWRDEERGLLKRDRSVGAWVHPGCLEFFGLDTIEAWERAYIDPL